MAKTPKKDGTPWTKQEIATLKKMAPTRPVGIIAYELDRSVNSVRSKAQREGISLSPPERSPYGRPARSK